tara:strand:+ start:619 stop:1548 length:930 start_codon:yes stop_codon:yes gene_type:complete
MRLIFFISCLALFFPGSVRAQGKLKVFVLAGQSNMEGAGQIQINPGSKNGGKGSLEYLVKDAKTAKKYAHTVNRDGSWRVRDDVWIWYLGRKGGLSVGYGAKPRMIGPEFQIGHVLGEAFKEQVLLIKTAWGGKTLVKDFRPPSSGGEVGPYYTEMLGHVREVLANLKELFPSYDGNGYELSGFFWHQGWNDGLKKPWVEVYEENLANLVKDLRKEWKAPGLPVSIGVSGFGGRGQKVDRRLGIIAAQHAVARRPELKGRVVSVETRDFFRPREESPSGQGYHWNGNAETYCLIGEAMAKALLEVVRAK